MVKFLANRITSLKNIFFVEKWALSLEIHKVGIPLTYSLLKERNMSLNPYPKFEM